MTTVTANQFNIQVVVVEVIECPICLSEIEGNNNKVTTECGHTFHCKCLMTNVAHNGFACPYCRSVMIDDVYDSEDDEDEDEDENREDDEDEDEDEEVDDDSVSVAGPGLESHLLRGMRWMFQRVNNENDYNDDDESVWETDSEASEETGATEADYNDNLNINDINDNNLYRDDDYHENLYRDDDGIV
jgi:hypothetical protein